MDFNGLSRPFPSPAQANDALEHVLPRRPLRTVLAFTNRSIDDVVNSPVAKREVLRYFKLGKWMTRRGEVLELERQWNPLGNR